jgi:catechol 1,2-dioxygenase
MSHYSRREFIKQGSLGLATLGSAGLVLRADARPTEASGQLGSYARYLKAERQAGQGQAQPKGQAERQDGNRNLINDKRSGNYSLPEKAAPTEDNILGPFYRSGAPFRAKITPPLEAGTVLVISGRVWGFDTKKPLAQAVIDIWQANAQGRYDNDDPKNPPAKDVFRNRARLITDETGYYEFETIHPAPYKIGPDSWRPSHIHYLVRASGYKMLVTQLYFKGDPHNKTDEFIKDSLIVEVREQQVGKASYQTGTFDIVLAAAPGGKQDLGK